MSLWDLVANAVEGVAQVGINTGKLVVSPIIAPLDGGEAVEDSIEGVTEGLEKIGKAD